MQSAAAVLLLVGLVVVVYGRTFRSDCRARPVHRARHLSHGGGLRIVAE
jgi:hypothetical protein